MLTRSLRREHAASAKRMRPSVTGGRGIAETFWLLIEGGRTAAPSASLPPSAAYLVETSRRAL